MAKEISVRNKPKGKRVSAEQKKRNIMKKESALNMALQTKTGLSKIAGALANPVKFPCGIKTSKYAGNSQYLSLLNESNNVYSGDNPQGKMA